MYVLYKTVQWLLRPELWIFASLIVAWFLSRSRRRLRAAQSFLVLGIGLFYALGITPTGQVLMRGLESQYAIPPVSKGSYDAIVVLSAGTSRNPQTGVTSILGTETLSRVICGIRWWRLTATPSLVMSGGVGDPFQRTPPEAIAMQEFAVEFGVPASVIVTDVKARHTAESAAEVRQLLPRAQRIVLVTTAMHLRRSTALFRKQGFDVTPAPCTFLAAIPDWSLMDFLPSAGGLALAGTAIHEYAGIAAYRFMGRL